MFSTNLTHFTFRPDDWIITRAMDQIQALPESLHLAASENAVRETPKPIALVG